MGWGRPHQASRGRKSWSKEGVFWRSVSPRRAVQGPGGELVLDRARGQGSLSSLAWQVGSATIPKMTLAGHSQAGIRMPLGGSFGTTVGALEHRPSALREGGQGGLGSSAPKPHMEPFASQGCPCRGQPCPPAHSSLPGTARTSHSPPRPRPCRPPPDAPARSRAPPQNTGEEGLE